MYFKMGIPLNVVDLPAGSYSVTVNGSRADFKLDTATSTSSLPLRAADMPFNKADIQVDAVNVDIGRGSPLPIHAIVSANLLNACAQLGEVRVHRNETTFFVRLIAYVPAQTDCNPDTLPMRIEVPLNIAYAPEGPFEVNVNGVTASFDHRTMPAAPEEAIAERNLIAIEHVGVQAGVGSPIPVDIVASGTWPDLCSQIASVESTINGFNIDITVLASTLENCRPDNLGLPFRFAITVNGISNTLDLPLSQ
jgi:hypothetical protein